MKKVSVICLCYNQAEYLPGAVASVEMQDYPSIELILVDDASTDNSAGIMRQMQETRPGLKVILNDDNLGNCAAFNCGFKESTGDLLIDLAADDLMLPGKLRRQVEAFEQGGPRLGVVHHDVEVTDRRGKVRWIHSELIRRLSGKAISDGHVHARLIGEYMVSSPSMMTRREVLDELGGYDEDLAYEDFDFWVRSSVNWEYFFIPEILMQVRKLKSGMSSRYTLRFDEMSRSTLAVCRKVQYDSRGGELHSALQKRFSYEFRQAFRHGSQSVFREWYDFGSANGLLTLQSSMMYLVRKIIGRA